MPQKSVWEIFNEECPSVANAYINLSKEITSHGNLEEKTRCLILVGIYSTTCDSVALRHIVGLAIKAGATRKEIESAALLAFSTGITCAELSIPLINDCFNQ